MADTKKQIVLPEFIGQRVRHRKSGYGAGAIDWAWINDSGIACITVIFDSNSECKDFDLLKCYKPRFLTFEDTSFNYDKILEIINSHQNHVTVQKIETQIKKAPTEVKKNQKKPIIPPKKEPVKSTPKKQSTNQPSEDNTKNWISIITDDLDELFGTTPMPQKETLTPEQQQEMKNAIYQYLTQERGVKRFVHFTPLDNLKSILSLGIVPRSELSKQHITAITPDPERLDFQFDYSSFSITFPNYLVFFQKRVNMKSTDFVILSINPRIILELPLRHISYLPDNAASSSIGSMWQYTGLESAKSLFGPTATVKGITQQRSDLPLLDSYPTNPQAEVFIKGRIPPEYINAIITEHEDVLDQVNSILLSHDGFKPEAYHDWMMFLPRSDHKFWKKTEMIPEDSKKENG